MKQHKKWPHTECLIHTSQLPRVQHQTHHHTVRSPGIVSCDVAVYCTENISILTLYIFEEQQFVPYPTSISIWIAFHLQILGGPIEIAKHLRPRRGVHWLYCCSCSVCQKAAQIMKYHVSFLPLLHRSHSLRAVHFACTLAALAESSKPNISTLFRKSICLNSTKKGSLLRWGHNKALGIPKPFYKTLVHDGKLFNEDMASNSTYFVIHVMWL